MINMVWLVKVGYLPLTRTGPSFFLMNLHRSFAGRYEHGRSIGLLLYHYCKDSQITSLKLYLIVTLFCQLQTQFSQRK